MAGNESPKDRKRKSEAGENDEGVTLKEAMEEWEELNQVSTAVLGASDPNNCSYAKGYLKRQALYACLTCNPKNAPFFQTAGICLACSYKCHDGHELVELYTKRNFRCDCGNKRFPDNPCTLQQEKDDYNERNAYNQNFSGLYCTCRRPYPDPDESLEADAGAMIQCVICEDWYHSEHVIPGVESDLEDTDDELTELICASCTPKLEFLACYESLLVKQKQPGKTEAEINVDVVSVPDEASSSKQKAESVPSDCDSTSQDSGIASMPEKDHETVPMTNPLSKAEVTTTTTTVDACHKNLSKCLIDGASKVLLKPNNGTLWSYGWRKKLCRCDECKKMYDLLSVSYLLDEEDTLENYEATGKAKTEQDEQRAEESFNRFYNDLGHVGQIEFISGINDMKTKLAEFLTECARQGKVVEKEDVEGFFEGLQAELRAKRARLGY